jgi:hypothetical protein
LIYILDECNPGVEEFSLTFVDSDDLDPEWVEAQIKIVHPGAEVIGVASMVTWRKHHGHYKHFYEFVGPWAALHWDDDKDTWLTTVWWGALDPQIQRKLVEAWLTVFDGWRPELETLQGGHAS